MLVLVRVLACFKLLAFRYEPSAIDAMSCVAFSTVASWCLAPDAEEEEAVDRDEDDQRQADFDD